MKAKSINSEQIKKHTMLILGKRDLEGGNVAVGIHGKGNLGAKPRGEAMAELLTAIRARRV